MKIKIVLELPEALPDAYTRTAITDLFIFYEVWYKLLTKPHKDLKYKLVIVQKKKDNKIK